MQSHHVEILVLDFGSQYTQLIARRLREYGIYTEIVPYFESLDSIKAKNPKGIILSGGPASVYEEGAYKPDSGIFALGIPVLGICYGMQYIAHFFGGKVVRAEAQEFGKAVLEILDSAKFGAKSGAESSAACENACADSGAESIVLETERTYLREYGLQDLSALQAILDEKTMYAWGHGFSENECREWIELQLARYEKYGFGLWAVVDKASGQIIGNAGLNYENIELADSALLGNGGGSCLDSGALSGADSSADSSVNGAESKKREILELGYIINHRFWKQGLGLEVARACAEYAFKKLGAKELYCLIKDDNTRSLRLARKLGMRVVGENIKHYRGQDMAHLVLRAGELVACVNADKFSQKCEAQEIAKATSSAAESSGCNPLFSQVKQNSVVWMSHADKVEQIPQGFTELAKSGNTHYCAIADFTRQIYALQFHPEVVHSECGGEILKNFALDICGADNSWNMKNFAEAEIAKLREKVLGIEADSKNLNNEGENAGDKNSKILDEKCGLQEKSQGSLLDINDRSDFSPLPHLSPKAEFSKVLCAVSGGVDSSVVATLLYRAIGENLIPVFVDTGLLRKGEREAVEKMFKENLKVPLIVADARELFLGRLQGVIDPEKKRKIIGETFIEVFESEAKKHNTKGEIKFLAQGTLYPDVIESVSVKGPSKTIKSHHNVGGLPEWMKFELIEPLRELFKDEVRALGRELGMPESMLMRHPFPGPGLAIRIMGEVNSADLELLKEADSIFIEELHKWGLYDSVWQGFCVLLNVRSVGVMGDNRTYDNTICVRAVEAMDGMTASFSHLPHEFLESVSNRIINEVEGINRVVYDITSKPPGTIEWE